MNSTWWSTTPRPITSRPLDRVFRQICRVLPEDGWFVSFDYVGPHRNQYRARRLGGGLALQPPAPVSTATGSRLSAHARHARRRPDGGGPLGAHRGHLRAVLHNGSVHRPRRRDRLSAAHAQHAACSPPTTRKSGRCGSNGSSRPTTGSWPNTPSPPCSPTSPARRTNRCWRTRSGWRRGRRRRPNARGRRGRSAAVSTTTAAHSRPCWSSSTNSAPPMGSCWRGPRSSSPSCRQCGPGTCTRGPGGWPPRNGSARCAGTGPSPERSAASGAPGNRSNPAGPGMSTTTAAQLSTALIALEDARREQERMTARVEALESQVAALRADPLYGATDRSSTPTRSGGSGGTAWSGRPSAGRAPPCSGGAPARARPVAVPQAAAIERCRPYQT